MKNRCFMSEDPSNALSEVERDHYEIKRFGIRRSAHSGWMNCLPDDIQKPDGWSHEASEYLCRLGEEDGDKKIKVIAESREGERIKEIFIDPSEFDDTQIKLIDLEPESYNILYDAVPWENGKRKEKTRFGWLTVSGCHPLSSFPEPVAYWAIGPHAYQLLIPWHMPVDLEDSCKAALDAAPYSRGCVAESNVDDLLFLPGSIIHAGRLPPFTALMKYDAFSVSELDDRDRFWTEY